MRQHIRILLSIAFQLLFFFSIPALTSYLPFGGSRWVVSWDTIDQHEIFKSHAGKKAVLFGASYWGERYCSSNPHNPAGVNSDSCMLSFILNIENKYNHNSNDIKFFQITQGGSLPQLHLYFLLNVIKISDGSVRYAIYDSPRSFTHTGLGNPQYFFLHSKLLDQITTLPAQYRSAKLTRLSHILEARISEEKRARSSLELIDWAGILQRAKQNVMWFGGLYSQYRHFYSPESSEREFRELLLNHEKKHGAKIDNDFNEPLIPLAASDYIVSDDDFLFLDIIHEICKVAGIKLLIVFHPDLRYYTPSVSNDWDNKRFKPTINHFSGRENVYILDYRDLPASVPKDSIDGVHASLSGKVTLAKRLLIDLERIDRE